MRIRKDFKEGNFEVVHEKLAEIYKVSVNEIDRDHLMLSWEYLYEFLKENYVSITKLTDSVLL